MVRISIRRSVIANIFMISFLHFFCRLVFKKALQQDRECGGVFQSWLKRLHFQKIDKLMILLDFQSLIEDVEKIEDRLLNLCAAWKFFQKYFHIQNGKSDKISDEKCRTKYFRRKKLSFDAFLFVCPNN